MNRKIILAVVLSVCLILAVFPIQASARQTSLLGIILEMIFPKTSQTEHIKILNPVSRPTLMGEWVVEFETSGEGDLEIEAYEGTYFGKEIDFLGLYCGEERSEVETYFSSNNPYGTWTEGMDNGRIIARNWKCGEKAKLVLLILETGQHHLRFSFLGGSVYAENYADCTGTAASPCYECDVNKMNLSMYTNQSSWGPYGMTYSSTSGTCQYIQGSTNFTTNEGWIGSNPTNVTFGVAAAGRTAVRLIGTPTWTNIRSTRSFSIAQSIRVDLYTGPTTGTQYAMAFNEPSTVWRFSVLYYAPSNQFRAQTRINSGGWNTWIFPLTPSKNAWYSVELIWYANGTAAAWVYPSTGKRNTTNHYVNSTFPSGGTYYLYAWCNQNTSYLSLFRNTYGAQKETWTYSGYNFCTKEAKYVGFLNVSAEGATSTYEQESLNIFREESGTSTVAAYENLLTANSYIKTSDGGVSPKTGNYMIKYNGTYTGSGNNYAYHKLRDSTNANILNNHEIGNNSFLHFCVYATSAGKECGMEINFVYGCSPAYLRWDHYDQDSYYIQETPGNPGMDGKWYCVYSNISDKVGCTIDYVSIVQENNYASGTFTCYYDDIFIGPYLYTVNWDNDENWCTCNRTSADCLGGSCWGPTRGFSFESGTSQNCCEDDIVEIYNYRDEYFSGAELPFDDDTTDDVCCYGYDCVYGGSCYGVTAAHDLNSDGLKDAYCYYSNPDNIRWINTDYHSSFCSNGGYTWNIGAGDATGDNYAGTWGGTSTSAYCHNRSIEMGGSFVASLHCCCGDDSGENLNTENTYSRAIAFDNDQQACCDTGSDCVGGTSCYTAQSAGTTNCGLNPGANDNCSHCFNNAGSGQWLDCDQQDYMDYWCGNVCGPKKGVISPRDPSYNPNASWNAVEAGEASVGEYPDTSTLECCGDDVSEYYNYRTAHSSMDNGYSTNTSDEACCVSSGKCIDAETCYANGATTTDADSDGDNDWCNSGTWYDCNTNAQCLNGGTQYECVDNDCDTHIISGGSGTTCDGANPCLYVQNSTGTSARFDDNGYVDVKGDYSYDQGSLTPPANSFIVHNSAGTPVLYIDDDGNLATLGRFTYTASPSPSGNNDFIVQDSTGAVAGFIDGSTGNMYFKGDLHYNSNF